MFLVRDLHVLQANLSNEIIYLSVYCHIHGTWVQQEVTQDSLHKTQRMDITSRLPGVAAACWLFIV